MQRLLQAALQSWSSQLLQQREALAACFGLGDVESLISSAASDPASFAANAPVSDALSQTTSIDAFIRMVVSSPSTSSASASSTASVSAASISVAACVKLSRENLIYAAIGCRSVLAREAASAASALTASAGVRDAVESEITQLKQQIQEQQQQMKQHEEQQLVSLKAYQVGASLVMV